MIDLNEPWRCSLLQIAQAIRRREISSLALTEICLERIKVQQADINAFIHLEADFALAAAQAADKLLAQTNAELGPLHGVPVARKDLFYREQQLATCGSLLRRDFKPDYTATCLQHLDAAGAVDLGGLNMSEFALHAHGLNRLTGPARNPWDTNRTAGGSSGGTAAAVAAGQIFAGLGSDTGGSVRSPAALCGVVGLLPTRGRISRHGMESMSHSLDAVGPLARSVADCAVLFEVLTGFDKHDRNGIGGVSGVTSVALNYPIDGRRLGVAGESLLTALSPSVRVVFQEAIKSIRSLGAVIVEVDLSDLESLNDVASKIALLEAAGIHASNLASHEDDYTGEVRDRLVQGSAYDSADYLAALESRTDVTTSFCNRIFSQVDALLLPAAPGIAPLLAEIEPASADAGSKSAQTPEPDPGTYTRAFNYLGLPALALPCGFTEEGMPASMQLVGPHDTESLLFNLGATFQSLTDHHQQFPML